MREINRVMNCHPGGLLEYSMEVFNPSSDRCSTHVDACRALAAVRKPPVLVNCPKLVMNLVIEHGRAQLVSSLRIQN
jgi:hypothetical protein